MIGTLRFLLYRLFQFLYRGENGDRAWAFEALYMDEESVYGAFFVPCWQTPGGALLPLTRPALRPAIILFMKKGL
jgi:hypothetical protein